MQSNDPDPCIAEEGQQLYGYGSRRPLLIAVSGQWVRPSEKLLAATVGFDHFLQKPADPQKVLELLAPVPAADQDNGS